MRGLKKTKKRRLRINMNNRNETLVLDSSDHLRGMKRNDGSRVTTVASDNSLLERLSSFVSIVVLMTVSRPSLVIIKICIKLAAFHNSFAH